MATNGTGTTNGGHTKAQASLVKAAISLFSEQGFSATSVQQITDMAGINKAMLYYYFPNKEELYNAIIEKGISIFEKAVEAAAAPEAPIIQKLRLFLTAYLSTAADGPELSRIVYREALGVGESLRQTVADHFRDTVRRLAVMLADAQRAGEAVRDDVDPMLAAYSLFGMANMYISRMIVNRKPLDVDVHVDHILDLYLRGIALEENLQPE